MFLLIVFAVLSTSCFQVRYLSTITPNNFSLSTLSSITLSSTILGSVLGSLVAFCNVVISCLCWLPFYYVYTNDCSLNIDSGYIINSFSIMAEYLLHNSSDTQT